MPNVSEIQVNWGDTDAGGLIYYPRFFHFAIVGLNDYFTTAGDGHPMEWLRQNGYTLPAVDAAAHFEAPLRAGDTAVIETEVTDLGESSLTLAFEVHRSTDGVLAATGEVSFVLVDSAFESTPLPAAMRDCVAEHGDGMDA